MRAGLSIGSTRHRQIPTILPPHVIIHARPNRHSIGECPMNRPRGPSHFSRRSALRLLSLIPLSFAGRSAGAAARAVGAVSDVKGIAVAELGDDRRPLAVRSVLHLGETLSTGDNS